MAPIHINDLNGSDHATLDGRKTNGANGTSNNIQDYDVIVVGAGFGGINSLYRMRKAGLKTHIFESGSDFGGVWYWNRYPGARVDSECPFYQLPIPEVYKTWNFTQHFPDHVELRRYFAHVDKVLKIRKDTTFNAKVVDSTWDAESSQWTVTTANGIKARAQFIVLATGLLHKAHLPKWPGQEKYKGEIIHSGDWRQDIDLKNKKVAVIGAGATAVQIVQEVAKETSQLTSLIRRPSFCLPLNNRPWTIEEQRTWKVFYPALFEGARASSSGFPSRGKMTKVKDETPEEVEEHFEEMWLAGGFRFLLCNYIDMAVDPEANMVIYNYWKKKVRERLTDPQKQKILTPDNPTYYFSTKRTPLEIDYYEVLNQDSVKVVDLNEHPIDGFTEKGLQLGGGGGEREFDIVIAATGFDSFTGSMTNMGLKSKDGIDIKELWKDGVQTHMGMTIPGFPNLFMVYSPQAPSVVANGTAVIDVQSDLIHDIILAVRGQGAKCLEPTREAAEDWVASLNKAVEGTLLPLTDSWWNTSNIPGKKVQYQNYILGLNTYEASCREKLAKWDGFEIDGKGKKLGGWKGVGEA